MRASPLVDLAPLAQGVVFLWRHPFQALALALLTVMLSFLGPALQTWASLPDDALSGMSLSLAALVPLELYFMPRFVMALDAERLDHPLNPRSHWRSTFESRWFAASMAKCILYVSVAAGGALLLLPGLILLAVFGWMPWRVLLRGESLRVAAKASASLMARFWPRLLLPFAVILSIQLLAMLGVFWLETHALPNPVTPWVRLTHPLLWAVDFGGGLLNLWITTSCLSLYHRLEAESLPSEPAS